MTGDITDQQQIAEQLLAESQETGISLGSGALLTGFTKRVLETALEKEGTEHPGYDRRQSRAWGECP